MVSAAALAPLCAIACGSSRPSAAPRTVALSNTALPMDTRGQPLVTGEASVLAHGGAYYFYFNDWGTCPGVDCCPSSGGCPSCCFDPPSVKYPDTCVYANGHSVVVYRTSDFTSWDYLGIALSPGDRKTGIEFRPHVVFHAPSNKFVMWYEDRWTGQTGYAVAESDRPEGPFKTVADSVVMHGEGRTGDFNLFVDDDGTAYHVRTGLVIEKLTADYRAGSGTTGSYPAMGIEAPALFKRNGTYYLVAGEDCCACLGGSNIFVYTATRPLGPYTPQGDVGSVSASLKSMFEIHDPSRYTTRAQGSDIFVVPAPDGSSQFVWLGNQWVTATEPGRPRDRDLLYWSVLQFDSSGAVGAVVHQDAATVTLASN